MPSTRFIGSALAFSGLAIGALIPVFLVLYPASGLTPDKASDPGMFLTAIARSPWLFLGPGVIQILGHAIGAAAVIGLWWRFGRESYLLTCATAAGIAWMTVDLVDNAITIQLVPSLALAHLAGDPAALTTFAVIKPLTDALRLGGHVAGGLWVIGASVGLRRGNHLHAALAAFGVIAGAVLSANALLPALLNVSFLTLPLWLVLTGIAVARQADPSAESRARTVAMAAAG